MRAGWKNIFILQIIVFLYFTCEPAPRLLPIGDYDMLKLVDMQDADVVYPRFVDENRIIFYCRNSDVNYRICQTDSLGTNVVELFNDQSGWIEGLPQLNESCSVVAFTMGEFIEVDLDTLDIDSISYQTTDEFRPKKVRLLRSNVYTYNILSGKGNQITHDNNSRFIKWLDDDRMLIMVSNEDTAIVAQTDRRLLGEEHSIAWAFGYELLYTPKELQTVHIAEDSVSVLSLNQLPYLTKEISEPDDISLIVDTLLRIAAFQDRKHEKVPESLARIVVSGEQQYNVISADSSRIILTYTYKDTHDRFREKHNLVVVDLKNCEWRTLIEGIPASLFDDIRMDEDHILTVDGKYRIGKVSYDGVADYFLQINESVGIKGLSASPSGRLFVVSAWVGKGGCNLYLFRRKNN